MTERRYEIVGNSLHIIYDGPPGFAERANFVIETFWASGHDSVDPVKEMFDIDFSDDMETHRLGITRGEAAMDGIHGVVEIDGNGPFVDIAWDDCESKDQLREAVATELRWWHDNVDKFDGLDKIADEISAASWALDVKALRAAGDKFWQAIGLTRGDDGKYSWPDNPDEQDEPPKDA